MPQFQWLKYVDARAALAARLADPNKLFWGDAELGVYLFEALRTWNALTAIWNTDYDLSGQIQANQVWYDLSSIAQYPRVRTVKDTDLYSVILYHLLEQQSPASLTGQFQSTDVYNAMQRRRDQIIQMSACKLGNIKPASTPGVRRTVLPDTTLYPIRNRFVPDPSLNPPISPRTLWRDDNLSEQYFNTGYLQQPNSIPKVYGVISEPPLSFDVDVPPAVAGNYDLVVLQSGAALAGTGALLGIPDDFAWVNKWGTIADLLSMDSEVTDIPRAEYCLQRYRDGLEIMAKAPWILLGTINGESVETIAVQEMDDYAVEWDSRSNARKCIVTAGTDFAAACPVPTILPGPGVTLTVVGNAPLPVQDNDFVQASRDSIDAIYDYAQHLASFKMGGSEFAQSKELAKNFFSAAIDTNARLKGLGLFRDLLLGQGGRQDAIAPKVVESEVA